MMRSLYSGVSGLKSHQTRMDVIGNNIANVNTTAYKSKSINFADMIYQTTQAATAPSTVNNTAGTNPRQIGLGVKTGAINTSITTEGASQSTGNPFDLKITGEAFFVVTDGTNQYFTRDGSFNVDSAGYLCMSNTGYIVEGWTTTDSDGTLIQDSVKPIKVLSVENDTYPASYTTKATISGIIDKYDDQLSTEYGKLINVQTLDDMGYEYNLKFSIKPVTSEQSSYKDATTTEFLFNFPDEFDLKDTSTYKFYRTATIDANATPPTVTGVNDEITATGLPSDLLDALKKEAQSIVDTGDVTDSNVITAKGTHATGTNDYVAITIDNGFLTKYNITDLGPASSLMNSDIGIEFSGDTMYEAFDSTGKSMGTVDIPATELAKLYTAETDATSGDPTGNYILDPTNTNATAPSIIMTRKTYTDGTPTSNTFALTDGTAVDLNYSDVSALLSLLGDGEMQSSYTVNEPTTLNETRDGYYTISLREMTDSNGDQVDISALGSTEVQVYYDISDGSFQYVGSDGNSSFTLNLSVLNNAAGNFSDVEFDMSNTSNVNNDGKSTVEGIRDDGYKVGNMTGVSIGQDGTITASYDNGMQKNIAQISVATFENAMGLENVGDNLYTTTANSGDFNGIGVDIKGSGTGYMTTGVLEMSNVDLSTEFTNMITTQRGFQANSRIITTSDTLLEELVNLKR